MVSPTVQEEIEKVQAQAERYLLKSNGSKPYCISPDVVLRIMEEWGTVCGGIRRLLREEEGISSHTCDEDNIPKDSRLQQHQEFEDILFTIAKSFPLDSERDTPHDLYCTKCNKAEAIWHEIKKGISTIESRLLDEEVRRRMPREHLLHMDMCDANMLWNFPRFAGIIYSRAEEARIGIPSITTESFMRKAFVPFMAHSENARIEAFTSLFGHEFVCELGKDILESKKR